MQKIAINEFELANSNSPNAGESVPRPYSDGVPRVEAPGTSSFRSGSATP